MNITKPFTIKITAPYWFRFADYVGQAQETLDAQDQRINVPIGNENLKNLD